MSRQRIGAKVRTNADFQAITRFMDGEGIAYELRAPEGKGHPILIITSADGQKLRYPIACTPRGRCNTPARVASLKRFLRQHGIIT
ncbi:hypothetical protein [Pararhodobacter sp.]|uniref:hypothetical protein n=1 Tax=Pararhodobacter sp. TaxID=2127056 RepID=UPI002FDF0666